MSEEVKKTEDKKSESKNTNSDIKVKDLTMIIGKKEGLLYLLLNNAERLLKKEFQIGHPKLN